MIRFANSSARAVAIAAAMDALAVPPSVAPNVCVVLGGDGTMLRAVHRHGPDLAYFGLNCGHLGFLMNELPGSPEEVAHALVDLLTRGRYEPASFPRLRMQATTGTGPVEGFALNDVYVERQIGQTCHLRVTVNDVEVVSRMVCDGIIAATALGSTAYSFSAGGSAAHPLMRAIHLTAICPHTPRLAPLVLPAGSLVRIEVLDPAKRPARAVTDGVPFDDVHTVEIAASGDEVILCFTEGHNFVSTMIRKLLHP